MNRLKVLFFASSILISASALAEGGADRLQERGLAEGGADRLLGNHV